MPVSPFKQIIPIAFLICCWNYSSAQNGEFSGMGNSSVMLSGIWSVTNNQAGLADIEDITLGFDYQNRFMLKETSRQTAGVVVPTKTGNFCLAWSRFGYHLYSENSVSLAFARKLGEFISAGVKFDYMFVHQSENYSDFGAPLLDIGLIAEPIENLLIGTHISNATRSKIERLNSELLPVVFRMGVGYYFTEEILVTCEAEKETSKNINLKTGLSYEVMDFLYIRTGLNTNPNQYSFGLGYRLNQLQVDISASTHELLPLSSQINLTYTFQK